MHFVLIIAILFATGYTVNGLNIKEVSQFTKVKLNSAKQPLKDRQIRAATNCEEAYQETLTPNFEECLNYLSVDDGEEYSPQQLDSFCNELHCARIIGPVYRDIAVLCNENSLMNFTTVYLPLFCTKNGFGDYCINGLEKLYISMPSYFNACLATTFDGRCTDACKQVAEYIETKLGCCYETFVQRASAIQLPREYIYPSDLFTKCYGKSVEPACSRSSGSVRPTRTSSMRPTRTSSIRPTRTVRPTRSRTGHPTRTGSVRPTRTRFNSGPTPI